MGRKGNKGKSRRSSNRVSMLVISLAVGVLLIGITVQSRSLQAKNTAYSEQVAQLNRQIENEEQRAAEIEEMEAYTKTDAYVEDVARDKLGLVYEGEKVFKPAQ